MPEELLKIFCTFSYSSKCYNGYIKVEGNPEQFPVNLSIEDSRSLQGLAYDFYHSFDNRHIQFSQHQLAKYFRKKLFECLPEACREFIAKPGRYVFYVESEDWRVHLLPWELLRNQSDDEVNLSVGSAVIRSLPNCTPPKLDARLTLPLRVLFLCAAPLDLPLLDFQREQDTFLKAIESSKDRVVPDFAYLGTFEDLEQHCMRFKPHIIHLSGHGTQKDNRNHFYFEALDGTPHAVDAEELGKLLFKAGVKIVLVSACQSGNVSDSGYYSPFCQTLVKSGIPFALGFTSNVYDEVATFFSEAFYRSINNGGTIVSSLSEAREEIVPFCKKNNLSTWAQPILFCNEKFSRQTAEPFVSEMELKKSPIPVLSTPLFLGYRNEIKYVLSQLFSRKYSVLLVTGTYGTGKSTFIETLIPHLLNHRPFVLCHVKGEKKSLLDINTLIDAIISICRQQHWWKVEKVLDAPGSMDLKINAVLDLLINQPLLLVLDCFDLYRSFRKSEQLEALLTRICNLNDPKGNLLITSTSPPFQSENAGLLHIVLGGYTKVEFEWILKRDPLLRESMDNWSLRPGYVIGLFQILGGLPILKDLLSNYIKKRLPTLKPGESISVDDICSDIISNYLEHLDDDNDDPLTADEDAIIVLLCIYNAPVPVEALHLGLEYKKDKLLNILRTLKRKGYVQELPNITKPSLWKLPSIIVFSFSRDLSYEEIKNGNKIASLYWFLALQKESPFDTIDDWHNGTQMEEINAALQNSIGAIYNGLKPGALEILLTKLEHFVKAEENDFYIDLLYQIFYALLMEKRIEKAKELPAMVEEVDKNSIYSLLMTAELEYAQKNWETSKTLFSEIIDSQSPELPSYIIQYLKWNLIQIHLRTKNIESAENGLLELIDSSEDPVMKAKYNCQLAEIEEKRGNEDKANLILIEALSIFKEHNARDELIRLFTELADRASKDDIETAVIYYTEAQKLVEPESDEFKRIEYQKRMKQLLHDENGAHLDRLYKFDPSLDKPTNPLALLDLTYQSYLAAFANKTLDQRIFLLKALNIANLRHDTEKIIEISIQLAQLDIEDNNEIQALKRLSEVRNLLEGNGDSNTLIDVTRKIASIFQKQGRLNLAYNQFERAISILQKTKDLTRTAETILNLVDIDIKREDLENAIINGKNAERLLPQINDKNVAYNVKNKLGLAYMLSDHQQEAIEALETALSFAREMGDNMSTRVTLTYLGNIYGRAGNRDKAVVLLSEAYLMEVPQKKEWISTKLDIGIQLLEFQLCEMDSKSGVTPPLVKELLSLAELTDSKSAIADIQTEYADFLLKNERLNEALTSLKIVTDINKAEKRFETLSRDYYMVGSVAVDTKDFTLAIEALKLSEKYLRHYHSYTIKFEGAIMRELATAYFESGDFQNTFEPLFAYWKLYREDEFTEKQLGIILHIEDYASKLEIHEVSIRLLNIVYFHEKNKSDQKLAVGIEEMIFELSKKLDLSKEEFDKTRKEAGDLYYGGDLEPFLVNMKAFIDERVRNLEKPS